MGKTTEPSGPGRRSPAWTATVCMFRFVCMVGDHCSQRGDAGTILLSMAEPLPHPSARKTKFWPLFAAAALALFSPTRLGAADPSAGAPAPAEGATIRLTREAVLNGVTLAKGTELRIVGVKKDAAGAVTRVDLQLESGDKKVFKGIAAEALSAL